MVLLEACYGYVAYLEWNHPQYVGRLAPDMAPGVLLASLKLIERVIRDPSAAELPDRSNRDGTVVVFGSAGDDAEWHKMCIGIESLRRVAEDDAAELSDEAGKFEMAASAASGSGDESAAIGFAERAILLRADAQVKLALAAQCLQELVANDRDAIVARYRAAGNSELVTETPDSVDCGTFGSASVEGGIVEGGTYEVPSSLDNAQLLADNPSLRSKIRAIRCRAKQG